MTANPAPLAAVLDTSFWVAAYRAEVLANCFDLFTIIVPLAVEAEILAVQIDAPRREYPYATLFRQLRDKLAQPPVPGPTPVPLFGAGEAEAIALALHLHALLLINERRAAKYAANLGLAIVSVPAVIVGLRAQDVISDRAAQRKLELIDSITASEIIVQARRVLSTL